MNKAEVLLPSGSYLILADRGVKRKGLAKLSSTRIRGDRFLFSETPGYSHNLSAECRNHGSHYFVQSPVYRAHFRERRRDDNRRSIEHAPLSAAPNLFYPPFARYG